MLNHPFKFFLSFSFTFLGALYFLRIQASAPIATAHDEGEITQAENVISEESPEIEPQVAGVSVMSEKATVTPVATLLPSSSPKPIQTVVPTPVPTLTSQPTPALVTPTPQPTATPLPTATPDVWAPPAMEGWFSAYAGQYGVDKNILERLANCESHFNPNAINGGYVGMFQFSASTWSNYRIKMGLDPDPDLRTNAEESIKTAAFMVQQRGTAPWPSCLR